MSSPATPSRSRSAFVVDSNETHRQISGGRKQAPSSSTEADVSSRQPLPASRTAGALSREDCWSVEATRTLIDAWGSLYRKLNRGNLRHPHWQEVANSVNAVHATCPKYRRTEVQCKNRIDTVKKKYKIEKSKTVQSDGRYHSTWPHFESLDFLIGDSSPKPSKNDVNGPRGNIRRRYSTSPENSPSPKSSSDMGGPTEDNSPVTLKDPAARHQPTLTWTVPVGPRTKRARPNSVTERNFSVMAAAAAAAMGTEDDEEEDSGSRLRPPPMMTTRAAGIERNWNPQNDGTVMEEGYKKLADSITMLAQIYQKVEEAKQRHIVDMEKQRMQFARDLEIHRMKIYMETQLQIEKRRRGRPNTENYSCNLDIEGENDHEQEQCYLCQIASSEVTPSCYESELLVDGNDPLLQEIPADDF